MIFNLISLIDLKIRASIDVITGGIRRGQLCGAADDFEICQEVKELSDMSRCYLWMDGLTFKHIE